MLDDFSSVVLALYQICRELPVEAYQDAAFEQIKPLISFDSGMWMTGMLTAKGDDAIFHTVHLYKQPPQLIADWSRTKDRTVFSRQVLAAPNTTLTCDISRGFGPELAAHSRRYGIEHIMATASMDSATSLHELISLWRADPQQPFTEQERRTQQALVPHLSATWRINRMLHLNSASQPTCTSMSPTAAADNQGVLHLIEPGFTRLLQHEWPKWRGAKLPDELVSTIENRNEHYIGKEIVIRLKKLHDQFLLLGRKKSAIDNFGQNKREVARLFSSGHTHKEIAQMLGLSPSTIRNYLSAIYLKLGINSKTELANLMRDHA